MSTSPLVSVIIPTYNRARLLPRAVRSVQEQTHRPLEILVVDDGSTDDTPTVIETLNDGRLQYMRHETNRGASAARNTGLSAAHGRYVAFLDADDEWLPAKLSRQTEMLHRRQVGACHTRFAVFTNGHKRSERSLPTPPPNTHAALLLQNDIGTASTVVVERDLFQALGGFDERLPSCQDWDAWIRLTRWTRFAYVPEVLARYHFHTDGGQITANAEAVISGHEALLYKHRAEIEALGRHALARHHLRLGRHCCRFRKIRRARHHLLRAVLLDPLTREPYPFLAASLLGKRGYRLLAAVRRKMSDAVQKTHTPPGDTHR